MKNMMIYLSEYEKGKKTFKLIPMSEECPFIHAMFLPDDKILSIFSKEYKERPIMMPKLSDKGLPVTMNSKEGLKIAEERRMIDMYYEYALSEKEDIINFLITICIENSYEYYKNDISKILENSNEEKIIHS